LKRETATSACLTWPFFIGSAQTDAGWERKRFPIPPGSVVELLAQLRQLTAAHAAE
jgi:hypothetical protein